MKKLISTTLSLLLLLSSVNCLSFAADSSQTEATFTIKTNLPLQSENKTETKTETKTQELTKEEKEAIKIENEINEKMKNSYSDITEVNPCMKDAVKEVQQIFLNRKNCTGVAIDYKLKQLKAEKESLLKYKQSLLENNSDDNNVKKQIKNINDRLQAIEYTENYLNAYCHENAKEVGSVLLGIFGALAVYVGFIIYVSVK